MLNRTSIIIGIAASLIGILAFFNFKPENHSLEYVLSNPVPQSYGDTGDVYCQELTVTNTGRESIRGINISIDLKNISVADKKLGFSEDVLTILPVKERFEAKYSELKIGHSFRISFLTSANLSKNLLVSYSNGRAKMRSSFWSEFWKAFFLLIPLSLFINIIKEIFFDKRLSNQFWEKIVRGYSLEEILTYPAPFFLKEKEFLSYRNEAIQNYWKLKNNEYSKTWSETEAIKFLNSAQPQYMSEAEWDLCKECIVYYLQRAIRDACLDKLYQLLMLPLPTYCPNDIWKKKIIEPCVNAYGRELVVKIAAQPLYYISHMDWVRKLYRIIPPDTDYYVMKDIKACIQISIAEFLFKTRDIQEQNKVINSVDFLEEEEINELKRIQEHINQLHPIEK